MKTTVLASILVLLIIMFLSCEEKNKISDEIQMGNEDTTHQNKDTITDLSKGKLTGHIFVDEGDCMPSGEGMSNENCITRPVSVTIFICSQNLVFSNSIIIDSTKSNLPDGLYEIELLPGQYSMFIKDDIPSEWCSINCLNYVFGSFFKITKDSTTTLNGKINHASI